MANMLNVTGLAYDIVGVSFLGWSVVANSTPKIAGLVSTGWGYNQHQIPTYVENRNDGVVGLGLVIAGFVLQMWSGFADPGDWVLVAGLGILAAMVVGYLSFRRSLVRRGAKPIEDLLGERSRKKSAA